MQQCSIDQASSNQIPFTMEIHQNSLSLPSSSYSRLKYLTQQISKCCSTQPQSPRKSPSLYQRIQQYKSNLQLRGKIQQEQELLKKKMRVYKKQLGRIQQERKINTKQLLRTWSLSCGSVKTRNNSSRLNSSGSRKGKIFNDQNIPNQFRLNKNHSKTVNNSNYYLSPHTIPKLNNSKEKKTPSIHKDYVINKQKKHTQSNTKKIIKKSKFSNNLQFQSPSFSFKDNKLNQQNKLLSLFSKSTSKIPRSVLPRTHSPQHKTTSFFQRRSNAYSVLYQRGRSLTKALNDLPSPKQIFKIQAMQQIDKIMKQTKWNSRQKMNKLMQLKIKMNNVQSDESKDGNVGKKIKQCILQLYNNIFNQLT